MPKSGTNVVARGSVKAVIEPGSGAACDARRPPPEQAACPSESSGVPRISLEMCQPRATVDCRVPTRTPCRRYDGRREVAGAVAQPSPTIRPGFNPAPDGECRKWH